MSLKIKDKIIYITVRSVAVLILVCTLCVLVLWDRGDSYTKTFESVLLLAVGFWFGKGEAPDEKDNTGK